MIEPDRARFAEALAEELEATRRMLEELALQLCQDPVVFERQAGPLQAFDHVGQVLWEVAGVLRHAGSRASALEAIGVDTIRSRLSQACAA